MAARVTQGSGYVGAAAAATNDMRITQGAGYMGVLSFTAGIRVTQGSGYVGVRTLIPGCITHDAQCWKIVRLDGTTYRFTAHDKPVTFRGEVYTPCGSLQSSALQTSAEFGATENMDLSGFISSDLITQVDLWSGKFDGATVEVWKVDWSNPTRANLMATGKCGSLSFGTSEFTFEVTTAGERLQQKPILQPYMPTCRFKLGDARCAFNLPGAAVTGAVTDIATPDFRTGARRRLFTDVNRTETNGFFQLGRLTWTSGDNNGVAVDVKSFLANIFILEQPMQYDIQVGDTYSVTPGCDRTLTTCDTKFANSINFGGFPHLRGVDDLQKTPGYKE